MNASAAQPTAAQIDALRSYAKSNGRYWKAALLLEWTNGTCASSALQELRNQLGPTWLLQHGAAAVKPATLAEAIAGKRSEVEATGLAQWSYAKPEEIKDCPSCGAALELVKAEEGGEIEEPYFPKYPLRDQPLPRKRRPASFFACPSCEHCEEVKR